MPRDVFPSTQRTWIDDKLDQGSHGRRDLNRHIMELYAHPLEVYLTGIPYMRGDDHADLIRGFFADRLDRTDFFDKWHGSGRPLRRWLTRALWYYLKERHRANKTPQPMPLSDDQALSCDRMQETDRAFLVSLVEQACKSARAECQKQGLSEHWNIFLRHDRDGESYSEIVADLDIDERRAGVMVRTARGRFERAISELFVKDGIAETEVPTEVRKMLEDLQP